MKKGGDLIGLVAFALLIVGGLNWGLYGLFNFDLVALVFGGIPILATIVYVLIGLAAVLKLFVKLGKKKK